MTFVTMYGGNHGNNIVSSKVRLPESQELLLKKIGHAMGSHPFTKEDVQRTICIVKNLAIHIA